MENAKQNILSARRRRFDSKQVAVECVINLDENQNIEKVLALTAHTEIKDLDASEKETRFSGEIFLNLFYLTPDKQIDSVATVCDYSDFIRHDALGTNESVRASAKIVGINPTSIANNTFRVVVTVEVEFALEGNAEISMFENHAADCRVMYNQIAFTKASKNHSQTFNVEKETELKEKVEKVLMVNSQAVIKEARSHDGFVTVEGDVYYFVVYAKEGGGISQVQLVESFKEELEVEESDKDAPVYVNLTTNQKQSALEISEIEGGAKFKLITGLKADVKLYKQEQYASVSDIYSLTHQLEVKAEKVKSTQLLNPKYFEGKIEGNLTLSETQPRIDKTLAVSTPKYMLSNVYIKDDEIFVEGTVSSNLVYLNDETETVNSVEVEVPFVTSEKYNIQGENLQVEVQIALSDCDMIAKRGREIYFDCKIKAYANVWAENQMEVITKVEHAQPHAPKDSAIEIYFAKSGDWFWDIAKQLKVDESVVAKQNPGVKNPLEGDEKIVVYYGIEHLS